MINECYRCGVSGEKVRLYDAISSKGIVKICDECNAIEKLPVIKKPTGEQITESERQKSVRDRLANMNRRLTTGREMSLREIVDRDLKAKKLQSHPDLIDNFHWSIQRVRRNRKITREQFAKGINESEATVRMIEQGFLPENDYRIINKIEGYLRINLHKLGTSDFSKEQPKKYVLDNSLIAKQPAKQLAFDLESAKNLKIADIKEMKKRQEEEKKPVDSWEEEYSEDDEKFLDKKEDLFDENEEEFK
jgi:ribosome-binding protein aMBF1 (putative translation factor)